MGLDAEPVLLRLCQRRGEHLPAVADAALAVVHRRVRAVDQGLRPVAVLGRARDADAGGDRELLLLEPEAVAEGIEDGIGDALGPILAVLGAASDQSWDERRVGKGGVSTVRSQ